jgi:hypothetical protein
MWIRSGLAALALCAVSFAESPLSVQKLVEAVKSSVAQKASDTSVATWLATVRLANRLEDRTIEELKSMGVGPRTLAALEKLGALSAKLPTADTASDPVAPTPKYVQTPPPPNEEQSSILAAVREYAVNYSKTLPDFICLQVTRRSVDPHYQSGGEGSWTSSDRIVEKLSYFNEQEKYEPITANDNAMFGNSRESLGGSLSRGEFGSLLRDVFEPMTEASFEWDHWGRWDGNPCYVFRYRVDQSHSSYGVDYEHRAQTVPGYHGLVYLLQKRPNAVIRLTIEPEMPESFPVQEIHQAINYKYAEITGHQYLLPATSTVQSRTAGMGSRNEIEFRRYQKYAADTTITFDDADETPQQKTAAPKKP